MCLHFLCFTLPNLLLLRILNQHFSKMLDVLTVWHNGFQINRVSFSDFFPLCESQNIIRSLLHTHHIGKGSYCLIRLLSAIWWRRRVWGLSRGPQASVHWKCDQLPLLHQLPQLHFWYSITSQIHMWWSKYNLFWRTFLTSASSFTASQQVTVL